MYIQYFPDLSYLSALWPSASFYAPCLEVSEEMSAYTLVLSWPLLAIPMLGVSLLVVFLPCRECPLQPTHPDQ